jgi:hypothetical protein
VLEPRGAALSLLFLALAGGARAAPEAPEPELPDWFPEQLGQRERPGRRLSQAAKNILAYRDLRFEIGS